ncbi:MAG: hypothetical protein HZB18_11980 [Chloroflexi bacterium]|nr:hypothetical protein [Chloroflexota bacterium]
MLIPSTRSHIIKYLPWLGALAASVAIAVYMYFGTFTRYMSDDYCLLVDLNSGNIFTASWNKYLFTSNRFSNLFVLGLWELFGPRNVAYIPALLIVLWVGGLFWLFSETNKLYGLKLNLPVLLLAAELLAVFTFYMSPNLFQSVYWRPGQVTYFTPLVFFTLLAAWLVNVIRLGRSTFVYFVPFVFISFFIGGLSETIGAFHITALLLAALAIFFFDKSPRRKPAWTLLTAMLIGAFAALLAMLFAPANSLRISEDTPSSFLVLSRSLQYTWSFIIDTLSILPTPSLALFGISALASCLLFIERPNRKIGPRFWLVFVLIPLIAYGLIFAIVAPSAYGQSYPVERVRFPAHFVLNAALLSLGVCIGVVAAQSKLPKFAPQAAILIAALAMLYPFWMIRQPVQTYPERRLWAQRWDEREAYLHSLITAGETDLAIPALDGYEGTKELDLQANFWVNRCAAEYYGVNSIATFSVHPEEIKDYFSE